MCGKARGAEPAGKTRECVYSSFPECNAADSRTAVVCKRACAFAMTLPAWRCLFTVRITWQYSTPLLYMRACGLFVWLSLHMGLCSIVVFIIIIFLFLTEFSPFCSLFPTMANISIFLSYWHAHINFYSQFSQLIRRYKDYYACKNWWYLCIVLLREITQNTIDRNIANLVFVC